MGISREQALDCLRSDDLIGVGMEADAVRRRLHPEGVVSYAIGCTVSMADGARTASDTDDAARNRLYEQIAKASELGCTGVRLASGTGGIGGRNSDTKDCGIEGFEAIFHGLRRRFPALSIEGPSATGILALAAGCGLGLRETIARLRDAGMDSIASVEPINRGAAARSHSAQPQCSAQWIEVHRVAHTLGMRTVASMVCGFGANEADAVATGAGKIGAGKAGVDSVAAEAMEIAVETRRQQVDLLHVVRRLQEETGGFTAFLPWDLGPCKATSGGFDGPTAVEQMKTLAVARIFLDNIENIQLSGATQSLKVVQTGLRFGANDVGPLTPEGSGTSEEDVRRIVRDAGFQPAQRDMAYRTMMLV